MIKRCIYYTAFKMLGINVAKMIWFDIITSWQNALAQPAFYLPTS